MWCRSPRYIRYTKMAKYFYLLCVCLVVYSELTGGVGAGIPEYNPDLEQIDSLPDEEQTEGGDERDLTEEGGALLNIGQRRPARVQIGDTVRIEGTIRRPNVSVTVPPELMLVSSNKVALQYTPAAGVQDASPASNAVDGTSESPVIDTCSDTGLLLTTQSNDYGNGETTTVAPWWSVTLGSIYLVQRVIIYNSVTAGYLLRNVRVVVGSIPPSDPTADILSTTYEKCAQLRGASRNGAVHDIYCRLGGIRGSQVSIINGFRRLVLCAVEVYALQLAQIKASGIKRVQRRGNRKQTKDLTSEDDASACSHISTRRGASDVIIVDPGVVLPADTSFRVDITGNNLVCEKGTQGVLLPITASIRRRSNDVADEDDSGVGDFLRRCSVLNAQDTSCSFLCSCPAGDPCDEVKVVFGQGSSTDGEELEICDVQLTYVGLP